MISSAHARHSPPARSSNLCELPGWFRVYPTGSFPGMVFSGIYRVSLFLCFSLKGFRNFFSGLIPVVLLIMKMRCIVCIF